MTNLQVSFAKHGYFYKIFFSNHNEMLIGFISTSFFSLKSAYTNLEAFYGSYSYYLKDEYDVYKELVNERHKIKSDTEYLKLASKSSKGIQHLTYTELARRTEIYFSKLTTILEIFESFCHKLAPDDVMPNITETHTDYEKKVMFASYEVFYECLMNLHYKINKKLSNFSIIDTEDTIISLMVFYYGYSYYISISQQKDIKKQISAITSLYTSKEFLQTYYTFIQSTGSIEKIKEYQERFLSLAVQLFASVNEGLAGKNIFPKKNEKIDFDRWLI